MARVLRERHISGVTDLTPRDYEIRHREIARRAAAEGMVLLRNTDNVLPIDKGTKIALYGTGAIHMIKGGTGSGDVNEREVVSIREGLENAGYTLVNSEWLDNYQKLYDEERIIWRDKLLKMSHEPGASSLFDIYAKNPMQCPMGDLPKTKDADIALFVLTRVAGEGADRFNKEGDYKLRDEEYEYLKALCKLYDHVVLVINTGGLIDLNFTDEITGIDGIIYMVQPGMEGGNALADVLSGAVTPSGKLTDSWAYKYEDYPSSAMFSHNDGGTDEEIYSEGIYVGYRYFDSFNVPVKYGFGFGLSYTSFSIKTEEVNVDYTGEPTVLVSVNVTNTGDRFAGKEVVQVYVSCPDGKLEKEYRRLVGYKKTKTLAPGESETLVIEFPLYLCASFSELLSSYVLEAGYYGIWVGSSIGESKLRAMLKLNNDSVMVKTEHCLVPQEPIKEISISESKRQSRYHSWMEEGKEKQLPIVTIKSDSITTATIVYGCSDNNIDEEALQFVETLSTDQLINLACGDPGKSQDNADSFLGQAGLSVPGSAAETSRCAVEQGLGSMVLSDGPAGLRLDREYVVSKDGELQHKTFIEILENGFFNENPTPRKDTDIVYYQFCTAFPVGTLLAQTWDTDLIIEIGKAVGEEMMEFQTALWLAPGMNIHRNPLCGRNFEYFAEDPVVSGTMAAAMTKGVQSIKGCGTTIKHFACNNNEENRLHCDSKLNERVLREIYLKGFEIAVKTSQPLSIMTSYNLVNGIHTANSYDLCTKIAREEWGFEGMFMTDWTTTEQGPDCTAAGCMRAGNDLVCPGNKTDHANLREELDNGKLSIQDLKKCVARYVSTVWKSNAYEQN